MPGQASTLIISAIACQIRGKWDGIADGSLPYAVMGSRGEVSQHKLWKDQIDYSEDESTRPRLGQ